MSGTTLNLEDFEERREVESMSDEDIQRERERLMIANRLNAPVHRSLKKLRRLRQPFPGQTLIGILLEERMIQNMFKTHTSIRVRKRSTPSE